VLLLQEELGARAPFSMKGHVHYIKILLEDESYDSYLEIGVDTLN